MYYTKYRILFKGLTLLGFSITLSVLIFPLRQQNKGPMRTTITEPGCWCLLGLHCEHKRSPTSLHWVSTQLQLIHARNLKTLRKCCLIFVRTMPNGNQSLRDEALEIQHFRILMLHVLKGLHGKSPPIGKVTLCQISDPCLKHKAFKSLKVKTTRILNLGRTIPLLVF